MNSVKRAKYKLVASIHTLSVRSNGVILPPPHSIITPCITSLTEQRSGETTSKINPNKISGTLYRFSDFSEAMDIILRESGMKMDHFRITRADLSLDSFETDFYEEFSKLNRYLLSGLAAAYSVKNKYKTVDLYSEQQLSVAIKNRYFECENYDKAKESHGSSDARARIEERAKSMVNNDLKKVFVEDWFLRWDKAFRNLNIVHKRYNDELEREYKEGRKNFPVQFRSLTDFLIQSRNRIFCKDQMVDLLSRFEEVKDPLIRAENHKKRYGIEYFSEKDVQYAIDEIKRATLEFFEM